MKLEIDGKAIITNIPVVDVAGIGQIEGTLTVIQHSVNLVIPPFNPVGKVSTTAFTQVVQVDPVDATFLAVAQANHIIQLLCHPAGNVNHFMVTVGKTIAIDRSVAKWTDIMQLYMKLDTESPAHTMCATQAVQVVVPVGVTNAKADVAAFSIMIVAMAGLVGGKLVVAYFRPGWSFISDITASLLRILPPVIRVHPAVVIVTIYPV